jgi:hypothetical protein
MLAIFVLALLKSLASRHDLRYWGDISPFFSIGSFMRVSILMGEFKPLKVQLVRVIDLETSLFQNKVTQVELDIE